MTFAGRSGFKQSLIRPLNASKDSVLLLNMPVFYGPVRLRSTALATCERDWATPSKMWRTPVTPSLSPLMLPRFTSGSKAG